MNLLGIVTMLTLKAVLVDQPYQTQNNLKFLQIEIFKLNPQINSNIVVQNFCANNIYIYIYILAYSSAFR